MPFVTMQNSVHKTLFLKIRKQYKLAFGFLFLAFIWVIVIFHSEPDTGPSNVLTLPSIFHYMPHLSDVSSLRPIYHFSKHRSGVSVVIGIPSIKRSGQSYLLATMIDLIEKMNNRDKEDTLIVIFIAEVDQQSVAEIVNDIKSQFEEELESGLIDIISAPASYYPSFDNLRLTLNGIIEKEWALVENQTCDKK